MKENFPALQQSPTGKCWLHQWHNVWLKELKENLFPVALGSLDGLERLLFSFVVLCCLNCFSYAASYAAQGAELSLYFIQTVWAHRVKHRAKHRARFRSKRFSFWPPDVCVSDAVNSTHVTQFKIRFWSFMVHYGSVKPKFWNESRSEIGNLAPGGVV